MKGGSPHCARSWFMLGSFLFIVGCQGVQVKRSRAALRLFSSILVLLPATLWAQVPENTYQELHWRMIGPFRGGRTRAAVGVPSQPNVFYIGAGERRRLEVGRLRSHLEPHLRSRTHAVRSAPSPSLLPIPTSFMSPAVKDCTVPICPWATASTSPLMPARPGPTSDCTDGQQIPAIAVDPRDPNRVFAAVLGHPYGPSEERGIYRSTDGGQNWQKVLSKDENTGGSDVEIDPSNPNVVYASHVGGSRGTVGRQQPVSGSGGGLFKSTDGGNTWSPLTNGLPKNLSQFTSPLHPAILIASTRHSLQLPDGLASIAPMTAAKTGHVTTDARPPGRIGGGDLPIPRVDPTIPI